MGGAIPHMSQVSWHWIGVGTVSVDGKMYDVGRGDPGGFNDCLIDSLRQCLGLDTNPRKVREDLMVAFADALDGRARVTPNSYLDLGSHWDTLLRSLFKNNTCGATTECDLQQYCVISLYRNNVNNGLVVGDVRAPQRLVIMNTSDMHFDPCLLR